MKQIILASTSVSRQKILKKFGIAFQVMAPDCDETPYPNESPIDLVLRLSQTKAQSIANQFPDAIVIGSDQVGVLDQQIIGKPYTFENAMKQLQKSRGKTIQFYTGLSVIQQSSQFNQTLYDLFAVTMRNLSDEEIIAYLKKDEPLHCAGSFKCDELGITLFEHLQGNDLNSLIGLPLIQLNHILIKLNQNPLLS